MPPLNQDILSILAGEHSLGLDDAENREANLQRLQSDPIFRSLVNDWDNWLAELAPHIRDVAPPPSLWNAISLEMAQPIGDEDAGAANIIDFQAHAKPYIRRWQAISAGAIAIAATFIGALLFVPATPAPAPLLISSIEIEQNIEILAVFNAQDGHLKVRFLNGADPADADYELWVIPDQAAPISLGLAVQAEQGVLIAPSVQRLMIAGAKIAISREPVGGARAQVPTGPVLAVADLLTL